MNMVQAILLSIVQGVTEFIPVSSSGHLVLGQYFLGVDMARDNIFFEMLTHFGTSIAIVLVYFKDLRGLFNNCLAPEAEVRQEAWRYVGYIVIGSLPVAIVGAFLMPRVVQFFSMPNLSAIMLLVTATFLYISRYKKGGEGTKVVLKAALIVGVAQALAPMPGISRSGITIVAALMIGVSRSEAGRFSFMLALPALMGAIMLDFMKLRGLDALPLPLPIILVSLVVSTVVGYFSLKILLNFIHRGHLHYFSYYCAAASLISLLLINVFGL